MKNFIVSCLFLSAVGNVRAAQTQGDYLIIGTPIATGSPTVGTPYSFILPVTITNFSANPATTITNGSILITINFPSNLTLNSITYKESIDGDVSYTSTNPVTWTQGGSGNTVTFTLATPITTNNAGAGPNNPFETDFNITVTPNAAGASPFSSSVAFTATSPISAASDNQPTDNSQNGGLGSVVLPIILTDFTAIKDGQSSALINWTTAQEKNVSHFSIQRKGSDVDNADFIQIGTVQPTNTSISHGYQFTDATPLSGSNFYRLVSIDVDGKTSYSSTALLNFGNIAFGAKLYPVPVKDAATISLGGKIGDWYNITIVDMYGRAIGINAKQQGGSVSSINLASLSAGTYTLVVRDNNGVRVSSQIFSKQDK